jgi:SAM-dependent methyltransferase
LLAPPARIIDVGCATGDLLQGVRKRGNSNVLGIEPNRHAAELARRRCGIEVFNGMLEHARLPDLSVDVALLSHVIEHLPSPSGTMAELFRLLRPGGSIVLWLPNADSLAARVLREWWIGFDAPRHLHTFSVETLSRLLEQHGFAVQSVEHEWIGLEWSWALRLILHERLANPAIDRVLATLHPALTAMLSPISFAAARTGQAGRIRVIAVKRGL